jgi:hypothetical protein
MSIIPACTFPGSSHTIGHKNAIVERTYECQAASFRSKQLSNYLYGTETRLSTLLTRLRFTETHVELIRSQCLESLVTDFLDALRKQMLAGLDGERLFMVVSRRFGLDGEPPATLENLAQQLGISRERVRQLEQKAIKKCKSKTHLQNLQTSLQHIALKLLDNVTQRPTPDSIAAQLEQLAQTKQAADVLRTDYEAKRAEVMKMVQRELEALETEYAPLFQTVDEHLAAIEAGIKNDVLRHGASITSGTLHAVYSKGRLSWDSKALTHYAETHPEINEFRKQSEPTVTIRNIKKSGG